jgi:hypothetical protein
MRKTIMPEPNALSLETLARIRALALEQVRLKDQLATALEAGDTPRVIELARRICDLEKEVTKQ